MRTNEIVCWGLSRVDMQSLYDHFPLLFHFRQVNNEDLQEPDALTSVMRQAVCFFINPKKINPFQLKDLIDEQDLAVKDGHAAMLIFTDSFTKEQKRYVDTTDLVTINLKSRMDRLLRHAVKLARKGSMPCWSGMDKMKANCFNDGWYLIDFETTGSDPLEDEIISISIVFMANYQLYDRTRILIKPSRPLTREQEQRTKITNEMLKDAVDKEKAIECLETLKYTAPFIISSEDYALPFIKALYHFAGKRFDHPYIAIDGLSAITFGHRIYMHIESLLDRIDERKYPRSHIDDYGLKVLYDWTLAVFENLERRFDVKFPGYFQKLYFADVMCEDKE